MKIEGQAPPGSDPVQGKGFRELPLEIHYQGLGEVILSELVVPVLEEAVSYDRLTGYFSINSLIATAHGIESLWRRGGRMRLVLGIHDVPEDLLRSIIVDDEWAENVIRSVGERLLNQLSTLRDELLRDRIATMAWMMNEGALEVKVAAPRSPSFFEVCRGIFHVKRLIFEDPSGDMISAVGSPNETVPGLSSNFEELTVHMSWREGSGDYVQVHKKAFDDLWNDQTDGLIVRDLDEAFANELLGRIGRKAPPEVVGTVTPASTAISEIIDLVRRSPVFALLNSGPAALYPHQERAVVEGLSRWPIRVMYADEVGLGKTLEAGSTISYLVKHGGVKRVLILVPAGLIRQWQDELRVHFDLQFWRYDSQSRLFIAPDGMGRSMDRWESPVGANSPDLLIISSQLARGTKRTGHIFKGPTKLPDLLVVDEAHAARVKPDLDGTPHPTRIWKMLEEIAPAIPHVVFVTATPIQMHWMEYHALLGLLGLPSIWREGESYERSLSVLANEDTKPNLEDAKWVLEWTRSSYMDMDLGTGGLNDREEDLVREAIRTRETPGFEERMRVMNNWVDAYTVLVKAHPAHLLTIRNTRQGLIPFGYKFPKRNLHAPIVTVPRDIKDFYEAVDIYLSEAYGKVEENLYRDRKVNLGFARTNYLQRLASSLEAARTSLLNRLDKIERLGGTGPGPRSTDDADEVDIDDEDPLPDLDPAGEDGEDRSVNAYVHGAVAEERLHIKGLVDILDRMPSGHEDSDPKVQQMLEIIDQHLQKDQILVFSRYTDTLDGCLSAFYGHFTGRVVPGHAMYTGKDCWLDAGDGPVPATKEDIKASLNTGAMSVVFCSEAASEGVNLQAARVLINIDVPWNPARLEQRIGRVDRLGQLSKEVEIYNLWYPDSVEARMYSKLLSRRELYQLAIGEAPELISTAIRSEIAGRFERYNVDRTDPFARLQELRGLAQHNAMRRVWDMEIEGSPLSTTLRKDLVELIGDGARALGFDIYTEEDLGILIIEKGDLRYVTSYHPGRDESLTLTKPILDVLEQWARLNDGDPATRSGPDVVPLCILENASQPISLCLDRGGRLEIIDPMDVPKVIKAIISDKAFAGHEMRSIPLDTNGRISEPPDGQVLHKGTSWLPDHGNLRTIFEDEGRLPIRPQFIERDDLTIRRIGSLRIAES